MAILRKAQEQTTIHPSRERKEWSINLSFPAIPRNDDGDLLVAIAPLSFASYLSVQFQDTTMGTAIAPSRNSFLARILFAKQRENFDMMLSQNDAAHFSKLFNAAFIKVPSASLL